MKIMMTKSAVGISRADGAQTMTYEAGKQYEAKEDWQINVLGGLVRMGVAHEIGGNAAPAETKQAAPAKAPAKPKAQTKKAE